MKKGKAAKTVKTVETMETVKTVKTVKQVKPTKKSGVTEKREKGGDSETVTRVKAANKPRTVRERGERKE